MATQAVTSGAPNNDGGTILHAGNVASTRFSNMSLSTNAVEAGNTFAVQAGAGESGNLGTLKALSAGVFGSMEEGKYVAKILGTRIAQTDNTFLRSGAGDAGNRRAIHVARGDEQYDLFEFSALSGSATYGANRGVAFSYINVSTGAALSHEQLPTDAVPGELVYMVKGSSPTQDDYKARTNP